MQNGAILTSFLTLALVCHLTSSSCEWLYSDRDIWGEQFPGCSGEKQSPIDIDTQSLAYGYHYLKLVPFLYYRGYNNPLTDVVITNDGHTVKIKPGPFQPIMKIFGLGPFPLIPYIFDNLHCHWGSADMKGSEHKVNGQAYTMECHLVHYNIIYGNLNNAIGQKNGIAVLGIFFDVESGQSTNSIFDLLIPVLNGIQASDSSNRTSLASLKLDTFLPAIGERTAVTYMGGLTTPTCNEGVIWIVFLSPRVISKNLIDNLNMLIDCNGDPLTGNFRPTQPLGIRKVHKLPQLFW